MLNFLKDGQLIELTSIIYFLRYKQFDQRFTVGNHVKVVTFGWGLKKCPDIRKRLGRSVLKCSTSSPTPPTSPTSPPPALLLEASRHPFLLHSHYVQPIQLGTIPHLVDNHDGADGYADHS